MAFAALFCVYSLMLWNYRNDGDDDDDNDDNSHDEDDDRNSD